VDDSATTVRVPVYGAATRVPPSFAGAGAQDGVVPPMMTFSTDSAFYVFNLAANWAYSRWADIYPVMLERILDAEAGLAAGLKKVDDEVLVMAQNGDMGGAVEAATEWGVQAGDKLTKEWFNFFGELFVRFRDGYDIQQDLNDPECGCSVGGDGYNKDTYERIVAETGDQYKELGGGGGEHAVGPTADEKISRKTKSKLALKAFL
jgi:hypothetical protein